MNGHHDRTNGTMSQGSHTVLDSVITYRTDGIRY